MSTNRQLSLNEACEFLAIHKSTIRRWEREGKISSLRTSGGHRRYDLKVLMKCKGLQSVSPVEEKETYCYARVSTNQQKDDLTRQINQLETFSAAKGWKYTVISDLGSGLNYEKKGLQKLIKLICNNKVDRLVITHKDRLLRFGSELIFSLCEHFDTEIVIINKSENSTFEEDLAQDVLEIITVFSAKLYGARSHKNKKTMQLLQEAAGEICKEEI